MMRMMTEVQNKILRKNVVTKNHGDMKNLLAGPLASWWITLFCCFFTACSTTKNLPEGETLYTGIGKLEVVNEDKTPAGVLALTEV